MATALVEEENAPAEEYDSAHLAQYSYSEESKKALKMLQAAFDKKDLEEVDRIVEQMVIKSQILGLNKLHTACGYGFVELVERYIVEDKVDPNLECSFNDLDSITPLHFCSGIGPDAISPDRVKCIDMLINNGAKINSLTSRNDTPLHWATKLAGFDICDKLIKSGADVNILNTDNCTCGHGAAFYKNIDVLNLLIDSKLDAAVQDISGKNILHLVCKDPIENSSQELEARLVVLVEKLVKELKMDVDCKDYAGFTPLMFACEHGNLSLIKKLIELGANVNYTNNEGLNALLLAIVNSLPDVVRFLLASGFDVKSANKNISYITDSAYLNEDEILKLLIDAGCDVNETKQDENGVILNPLWAACERSNLKIAEMLLKHGAKPIIREDLQMTALHCSCMAQFESLPIVRLLVEHNCPISMKSTQADETPLFLACNSGFTSIAEFLINSGVNPNDSNPISRTCLQQAIFRSHRDIVKLLIDKGYNITEEDKKDLNLYIMDLYQDNDIEMINYLLKKKVIEKEDILESIKKYNAWQMQTSNLESSKPNTPTTRTSENLKLNLVEPYPNTMEELESFLKNCNLKSSGYKTSAKKE